MTENYELSTFDEFEFFDIVSKKINFLKSIDIVISVVQQLQWLCGSYQKLILMKWFTKINYKFHLYFLYNSNGGVLQFGQNNKKLYIYGQSILIFIVSIIYLCSYNSSRI